MSGVDYYQPNAAADMIDLLVRIRAYYSGSNDYRPPYVKDVFDILDKLDVKGVN
jgi:hypothetical protein